MLISQTMGVLLDNMLDQGMPAADSNRTLTVS